MSRDEPPSIVGSNGTKQQDSANGNTTKESHGRRGHFAILNQGEEEEMEAYGYSRCWVRTSLCWGFIVLSGGLLRLVLHWWPQWLLFTTHRPCPLASATKLLVIDRYQNKHVSYFVKRIELFVLPPLCEAQITEKSSLTTSRLWLASGKTRDVSSVRWVRVKKLRYVWDDDSQSFVRLAGLDGMTASDIHSLQPLSAPTQAIRRILYGDNSMAVVVQSFTTLVLLELLNPFYVFQLFSLGVWISEEYNYYAVAIVIMSTFGITFSVRQTRKNQLALRRTVQSSDVVSVCRGGDVFEDVSTNDLVPGDVIVIPAHGCTMHCDAVLLNGQCIVNESMLTGESVPVTKTPLGRTPGARYDMKEDSRHTLFGGTTVIQTRFYGEHKVLALVIRTGYLTSKGSLVRSILYPPPADFRFERDSYKFIAMLAFVALGGLIYTCIAKGARGISAGDVAQKALDLITIVIAPALPSALSVGKLCAQNSLQKLKIFCVNSRVINVAGSLDCVCFDKTGTLTEDGLDLWGVVPVVESSGAGNESGAGAGARSLGAAVSDPRQLDVSHPLLCAMATCHSLTRIDGDLAGDPLDVKMFESTGWELEEPDVPDTSKFDLLVPTIVRPHAHQSKTNDQPLEIGLVHQFQFSSSLQRMSIVTRQLGASDLVLYCKGSPEAIASLCLKETVPAELSQRLGALTAQGYRVLGMARRPLPLPVASMPRLLRQPRSELEKELEFLGLIVMENRLKPQTEGVIEQLHGANIKIVMATGDNLQTAISVARECGLVRPHQDVITLEVLPDEKGGPPQLVYTVANPASPDERIVAALNGKLRRSCSSQVELGSIDRDRYCGYQLALSGHTWAHVWDHCPELLDRLCVRGAVFARMSSDQKQQLVVHLMELGYFVGMCGDGANDCGALKAAHTGISLSEAESSVASPLTATDAHIGCVPHVIREGRAALATSIGIFKFMVAYSLTEFTSVIILYGMDSNLTDLEFLFVDMVLVVTFAFLFSKTGSYQGPLVRRPPLNSLLSLNPVLSICLIMVINIVFQAIAYFLVRLFSWYTTFTPTDDTDYVCLENYAVFCVSMFQYIAMAVAYSEGAPYRAPIYSNRGFSAALVLMTALCAYITLWPADWVVSLLQLDVPPYMDFRVIAVALGAVSFALCLLSEKVLMQRLLLDRLNYKPRDVHKSRLRYLAVAHDLRADPVWPPIESAAGPRLPPATPVPEHPPLQATVLIPTISKAVSDRLEMTRL